MDAMPHHPLWRMAPFALLLAVWLAAAPAARAGAVAPATPATPPHGPSHRLDVLYTGFTDGVSSASVDSDEIYPLFEAPQGFTVESTHQDNVFRRGDWLLYTAHGPLTLEDFKAFFDAPPLAIRPAGPLPIVQSDHAIELQSEARQTPWLVPWLAGALARSRRYPDATRQTGQAFRVTNGHGLSLSLLSLPGAPPPQARDLPRASDWEMLGATSIRVQRGHERSQLLSVARPRGDGLRRVKLLERLLTENAGHALVVDAGNLLEPGHSELSRQARDFTFLHLAHFPYDAVVPGETEVSLDWAEWHRLETAVPLLAANLTPRDKRRQAPRAYIVKLVAGLKVALIGVADDRALVVAGAVGPQSPWVASDAIAAAKRAIASVTLQSPDMVLVITNMRDERLQQLRLLPGVSAVVGDFSSMPGEAYEETVALTGAVRPRNQLAYLVTHSSSKRVGHLVASFRDRPGGRPALQRLVNSGTLVTDRLPFDGAWRAELNTTLDRYQSTRRELLLPDLRDVIANVPGFTPAPPGRVPTLEAPAWSQLVAHVLRESTGSEVGLTRRLPMRSARLLGAVSALGVEGCLDVGDRMVQCVLPGKTLKQLVEADPDRELLAWSGYNPSKGKVLGYDLADDELYRVTTTDAVARHALFAPFFVDHPLETRWRDAADGSTHPHPGGTPVALRELVLRRLRLLKAASHGTFDRPLMSRYAAWLGPIVDDPPRWTVTLEDGTLSFNSLDNTNNGSYAAVRNARVTSASSLSLGARGKLAMLYDSPTITFEERARAIYKQVTVTQNATPAVSHPDDEAGVTSEARFKALGHDFGGWWQKAMPYVNGGYTTEFYQHTVAGALAPRRSELGAATGGVVYPAWGLKELRGGLVVRDDLANPGALEPGFQLALSVEQACKPLPGTLTGGLELTHYLSAPTDTPDRLGFLGDLTVAYVVPIWNRFNLTVSADYFMYAGKISATSQPGSNLDLRVGLGYALDYKPFYGVWF